MKLITLNIWGGHVQQPLLDFIRAHRDVDIFCLQEVYRCGTQKKDFMQTLEAPKILCGDFNLRPETESIKIIAEEMHDWVKESGVTSTRTRLYPKEEKFADYIFTSPEIIVENFKVLPDEVSDHAPLWLEFLVKSIGK